MWKEIIEVSAGVVVLLTAVWSGTKFHKFVQQLNDFEDRFNRSEKAFEEKLKDLKDWFMLEIKEVSRVFDSEIVDMKKERIECTRAVTQHMREASIHRDPDRDDLILTDIRDRLTRIENSIIGIVKNGINRI